MKGIGMTIYTNFDHLPFLQKNPKNERKNGKNHFSWNYLGIFGFGNLWPPCNFTYSNKLFLVSLTLNFHKWLPTTN